jgi:hypothetical protein
MRFTETVDIHIPLDDVLGELTNDELRDFCKERGLGFVERQTAEEWRDFADDIRECFRDGNGLHLEVLLIRMLLMAAVPREVIPSKKSAARA